MNVNQKSWNSHGVVPYGKCNNKKKKNIAIFMVLVTCRRISRNVVPFLPTTDLSHLPQSVNTLRDRLKQMTMLTIFSFCFFVNGCDCHTHFAWGQYSRLNMIGSSLTPYGNYKAGNPSTAACNTCKFVWETRRWFTSLLDSAHSQYKCSSAAKNKFSPNSWTVGRDLWG